MTMLSLSNVINISVASAQQGLGEYNTSNLALFTRETPVNSIGTYKIYLTASEVVTDFGATSLTAKMAVNIFSQQPNILTGGGYLVVIPFVGAEKLDVAITRTKSLVQYFGILAAEITADADLLTAAALVQTENKILVAQKKASTDLNALAIADEIKTQGYTKTRVLVYLLNNTDAVACSLFAAAYAGRAFSVNFSGSNTTQTMHLKSLVGVSADSDMTQTLLNNAKLYGADIYASVQAVAKTVCSGANSFCDDVYNQQWFVGALEVAGFNYLAQTNSKIPQSETGVSGLKSAYRSVIEQGIVNGYIGAGSWTSPDTFGNLEDFIRNISERGYYIYSLPVNKQSSVDRAARKAPLIQIAIKEQGAIHSSSVIVYINP